MKEQSFSQSSEPIQSSKNIWITVVAVIVTALIVGGGVYAWQRLNLKNTEQSLQQQISMLENQSKELKEHQNILKNQLDELKKNRNINDQQANTPPASNMETTNSWQLFQDNEVGFSLKYPKDIILNQNQDTSLSLTIRSEKIDSLDYPMSYDKETAKKDQQALIKGNYGKGPDQPLDISKKVRNIGPINGQEFIVISRFEVCDIKFERKLIFYHNGYQTVITLYGNKDKIISNNPQYFKTDRGNCGNIKIWNFDKKEQFYQDLINGSLSKDAQTWFNLFDDIVNTINI
ncbi:hypothetical protein GF322_01975 [Candidatus Dependentiae bacterium]|nr:hypothetical protein [Candidatus Dependentiae bacterium]